VRLLLKAARIQRVSVHGPQLVRVAFTPVELALVLPGEVLLSATYVHVVGERLRLDHPVSFLSRGGLKILGVVILSRACLFFLSLLLLTVFI